MIVAVRDLVLEEAGKGDVVLIGHGGHGLMRSLDRSVPRITVLLYAGVDWRGGKSQNVSAYRTRMRGAASPGSTTLAPNICNTITGASRTTHAAAAR